MDIRRTALDLLAAGAIVAAMFVCIELALDWWQFPMGF